MPSAGGRRAARRSPTAMPRRPPAARGCPPRARRASVPPPSGRLRADGARAASCRSPPRASRSAARPPTGCRRGPRRRRRTIRDMRPRSGLSAGPRLALGQLIAAIIKIIGTDGRRVALCGRRLSLTAVHRAQPQEENHMSAKIIVSYDGTANEDDAIALGRIFAGAGADVALAYVRHTQEPDRDRETLAQHEAQELLERGAALFGGPVHKHVVTDRSTPEGLRAVAEEQGADAIVFCSDSHTAKGHVSIGNSAERLLEGGKTAIAIAPAGLAEAGANASGKRIVAGGGGGRGAEATAGGRGTALGA